MKTDKIEIKVSGQTGAPAKLTTYILDPVSVDLEKKRPTVLILPGGGYEFTSDREGEPIAIKFLSMGYNAAILEYSVAPNRFPTALRQTALSIALVRDHASDWNVDKNKILVCGFSAGGHLACSIGAYWNSPAVYGEIGRNKEDVKPNGLILCYPVITSGAFSHAGSIINLIGEEQDEESLEKVSLEKQVTKEMPSVFLWHTVTDCDVPVENSLLLLQAMQENHVNYEAHLYPKGVHGLSLGTAETAGEIKELQEPCCQSWISLVNLWIENLSGQ